MPGKRSTGLGEAIVTAIAVMLAIALCLGYFNQAVEDKKRDKNPVPTVTVSVKK